MRGAEHPGGRTSGRRRLSRGLKPGGVAILHISDPQFGEHHRFGDGSHDSLAGRLIQRLKPLVGTVEGFPPVDLVVISGDVTERGLEAEFDDARRFIDQLLAVLKVGRERLVVVPGNHDINRDLCQAYFHLQKASNASPELPYAMKWKHYESFVHGLHGPEAFTPDRPYRLLECDELGVVVAALNSTIAESHRKEDHFGWCGEAQLRWFAGELERYDGWVRIGVVHHNVRRRAEDDDENLRDEDTLTALLGPHLDLMLHGHTHEGKRDHLADGTLVLATGSAAVAGGRLHPGEVPNQCQVMLLEPGSLTRWALRYQPNVQRWDGDTSLGPSGTSWKAEFQFETGARAVGGTRSTFDPGDDHSVRYGHGSSTQAFVNEVAAVTSLKDDVASVKLRRQGGFDYLAVFSRSGEMSAVGVIDGPLTDEALERFCEQVHKPFRSHSYGARSQLVHTGEFDEELRRKGVRNGVVVKTWAEYQNLLDLSAYREEWRQRLAGDLLYPQDLYLDQRYRLVDQHGKTFGAVQDELVEVVLHDLLDEGPRFVLVLGEPGFGKSFLMRRVAHELLHGQSGVTPIVILLREAEKRHELEEIVAPALASTPSAFQRDRFWRMFRGGRIVLLVDGYDEFAVRVGYGRAAEQLRIFLDAVRGQAKADGVEGHTKIIVTTRPNHFRSREDVTSQVFEDVLGRLDARQRRVYDLEQFNKEQQREFLGRWFRLFGRPAPSGEAEEWNPDREAEAWMNALAKVDNLPELAQTPRMLSFMAERLSLRQIRAAGRADGPVTAAKLYKLLVDTWLATEAREIRRGRITADGLPASVEGGESVAGEDADRLDSEQRWRVAEELAYHLWKANETHATEAVLEDVAKLSLDLPALGMTPEQAAHEIGTRALLVGEGEQRYFQHQSVGEFLLARKLAGLLRASERPPEMGHAELSKLTAQFLLELAPEEGTRWLRAMAGRRFDG